jgi:hypothetical protein
VFLLRHTLLTVVHRARTPLPTNWEGVALGKKEVDKLTSRGVEYEQERMMGGYAFGAEE